MAIVAARKKMEQPESLKRRAFKLLRTIIMFPRAVKAKYSRQISGLNLIMKECGDDKFKVIMQVMIDRSNTLMNRYVKIPMMLGIMGFLLGIGMNYNEIKQVKVKETFSFNIKSKFKNIKTFIPSMRAQINRNFAPIKKINFEWIFFPLVAGYIVSYVGAIILSMNPCFSEEERVRRTLQNFRFLDQDGEPWEVVWTPKVILFYAYGVDADAFVKRIDFWKTINFMPDHPKSVDGNLNTFFVRSAYELPKRLDYN